MAVVVIADGIDFATHRGLLNSNFDDLEVRAPEYIAITNAWIMGDKTGNARGSDSIDIQASRTADTQVASGDDTICFGKNNTGVGDNGVLIGEGNTSSSSSNIISVGIDNTIAGLSSICLGKDNVLSQTGINIGRDNNLEAYNNIALGRSLNAEPLSSNSILIGSNINLDDDVSASSSCVCIGSTISVDGGTNNVLGNGNTVIGGGNTVVGKSIDATCGLSYLFGGSINNTVSSVMELGMWGTSTRSAAIRIHKVDGTVSLSIEDNATAPTDGGATDGSEADGTLMRGGYVIRRDGDDLYIDLNIAGTIKTLSLGTAT